MHDLLVSKGGIALPQSHGLRAAIDRHKARLSSEFKLARLRRKASTFADLKDEIEREALDQDGLHPRWVRVNSLKSSVEEQLATTFEHYGRALSVEEVVKKPGKHVFIDPHIPRLLAVTPGVDLSKTEAYALGEIILQDKASCFPAYLLDPHSEDGDFIDACAAPGNKTTHLAAILYERQPEPGTGNQTIYAFERDSKRALTLQKMVKTAGSKAQTRIGLGQDFLQVDPEAEMYSAVGGLLLDPSCSGSGIVGRDSMPDLHLPDPWQAPSKMGPPPSKASPNTASRKRKHQQTAGEPNAVIRDDDGNEIVMNSERDLDARLDALASFQLKLLLHALRFPNAKKITYSTCSIHAQENESVVLQALHSDIAKKRGWQILKRGDQVTGMREWPVRGVPEYCGGDKEVAEGCIRSYKDDGQGVMGFFVAAFIRLGIDGDDVAPSADEDQPSPYLRDGDGAILRDVMGMPVLKSTGRPFEVAAADEDEGSDGLDDDTDTSDETASDDEGAASANDDPPSGLSQGDEWQGFAD